jgi:hypothetical protein
MPLNDDGIISKEPDGSFNEDYGKWCYMDGQFAYTSKDSLLDYLDEHPEADTSMTLYWAMRVAFHARGGFIEIDSTDIFHFSTLFLHEDSSVVTIPIKYEDFRKNKAWARVIITDKLGDTLYSSTVRKVPSTISAKVAPQTGMHISVTELTMTEFQTEAITVNTMPGSQTIIDTIRMQDKVQPQVAPRSGIGINSEQNNPIMGDTVYFYALDNGSGINQSRIAVTADADTIVVNIGDMLQRLTNHVYPSTTHRVVNPPGEEARKPRYSVPFFLHPNPDFIIDVLPSCIGADNPSRYAKPISAHEYLQERLREIKLI